MFLPRAVQLRSANSGRTAKFMAAPNLSPLIVAYLRKHRLSKALKAFVAETSFKDAGEPVEDLELIYERYLSKKPGTKKRKTENHGADPLEKKTKLTVKRAAASSESDSGSDSSSHEEGKGLGFTETDSFAKTKKASLTPNLKTEIGSHTPIAKTEKTSLTPTAKTSKASLKLTAKTEKASLKPIAKTDKASLKPTAETPNASTVPIVTNSKLELKGSNGGSKKVLVQQPPNSSSETSSSQDVSSSSNDSENKADVIPARKQVVSVLPIQKPKPSVLGKTSSSDRKSQGVDLAKQSLPAGQKSVLDASGSSKATMRQTLKVTLPVQKGKQTPLQVSSSSDDESEETSEEKATIPTTNSKHQVPSQESSSSDDESQDESKEEATVPKAVSKKLASSTVKAPGTGDGLASVDSSSDSSGSDSSSDQDNNKKQSRLVAENLKTRYPKAKIVVEESSSDESESEEEVPMKKAPVKTPAKESSSSSSEESDDESSSEDSECEEAVPMKKTSVKIPAKESSSEDSKKERPNKKTIVQAPPTSSSASSEESEEVPRFKAPLKESSLLSCGESEEAKQKIPDTGPSKVPTKLPVTKTHVTIVSEESFSSSSGYSEEACKKISEVSCPKASHKVTSVVAAFAKESKKISDAVPSKVPVKVAAKNKVSFAIVAKESTSSSSEESEEALVKINPVKATLKKSTLPSDKRSEGGSEESEGESELSEKIVSPVKSSKKNSLLPSNEELLKKPAMISLKQKGSVVKKATSKEEESKKKVVEKQSAANFAKFVKQQSAVGKEDSSEDVTSDDSENDAIQPIPAKLLQKVELAAQQVTKLAKETSEKKRKRDSNVNEARVTPIAQDNTKNTPNSKTDDSNGTLGKEAENSPAPKKRKVSDIKTEAGPKFFQKINVNEVKYADPRLQDNSYWGKNGAEEGWGAKAEEKLGKVKGKGFRHEKTKKKRGSYKGGVIDFGSHSIKFRDSDDE